ncbi:MAG: ATP-binding protein, partial [Candidatus Electrothrix sp. ATG2]|nr:ATP-binding protein [Candidatus Electrothrix sp. ATG2]
MTANSANLQIVLDWLRDVINGRLRLHLGQSETFEVDPLNLYSEPSSLSAFLEQHGPDFEEFTLLLLALAPQHPKHTP